MNKNTALSWANSLGITEQEFNRHLIELGYYMQVKNGKRLQRTPKGVKHSTEFLGKIRWDIDVVYDVVKLIGKKTGKYFYCEKCGAYNKVEETEEAVQNCLCHNCSYPVKLGVKKHSTPSKKIDESWWSYIKECVRREGNISDITFDTWIKPLKYTMRDNRVFVISPFEAKSVIYITKKFREIFKIVINRETGKHYIVSFVQPGEILIEDY